MRVSVLQENLAKALSIVNRAIPSRPTLPVLANVLLSTEDQRLKLSATNLELGITCWSGAKVDGDFATTVPARTLHDLVNNLSPERVDLEFNARTQVLNLRCGGTTANIKCVDASEFPLIPEAEAGHGIAIPADTLREMIGHVDFAAAREDNRPVLTGVLTSFEGDKLTMASADGYRLAVRTAQLEIPVQEPTQLIIPARALTEVARIISDDDEDIYISLPEDRNQVIFQLNTVNVVSSLIEGIFPDYQAIIPKNAGTVTQIYTDELLRACKRSEVFAKDSANAARIVISPADTGPGRIIITARSQEKGDNEGLVDASVEGEQVDISFNIRYLIDVLGVINEDQVTLETSGDSAPGVVRPAGREDFIHVIMPMSVGN